MVPPRTTTTILGVAQGMEEVSIVADSHPHMATETQMTMGTVEVAEATEVEGTVQEGRRTTTTIEVDLGVETIMVRPTAIRVEETPTIRVDVTTITTTRTVQAIVGTVGTTPTGHLVSGVEITTSETSGMLVTKARKTACVLP